MMNKNNSQKNKVLGQYYTPLYIVNYIISQTLGYLIRNRSPEEVTSIRILDPACGLGVFLVQALNLLEEYNKVKMKDKERIKREIIANQIYGIDIDSTQIEETQKNLGSNSFDINLKAFNALLPPSGYPHNFDVTEIRDLRNLVKKYYINSDKNNLIVTASHRIYEIENQIEEKLEDELKEKFNLLSNIKPMIWEISFPEVTSGFDIIIGNPPWGANNSILKSDVLKSYKAGIQQVDTWSLFIEQCIRGLKTNGRLGFILPNTLLSNENYKVIRKFILDECRIVSIVNLGEGIFQGVNQPCMIIILEKNVYKEGDEIEIVKYISQEGINRLVKGKMSLASVPAVFCSQMRFLTNPDYEYDIFAIGYEEIISSIEKDLYTDQIQVKPLGLLVKNARGVEINKKGRILQCSSCKWWNSPPLLYIESGIKRKKCINPRCDNDVVDGDSEDTIVFDAPKNPQRDKPFLVGHQVQRYYLLKHNYIDPTRIGINYKNPKQYNGPKLLLRKTGQGIKIVIDYDCRWVSQVVYLFKLKRTGLISLEYLLGILNSVLIQKYIYLKYVDPHRSEFPHFTQKKFLKLPIKYPDTDSDKRLAEKICKIAKQLQDKYQKLHNQELNPSKKLLMDQKIEKLEKRMNNLVFKLYAITPEQQDLLRSIFNPKGKNVKNQRN